MRSGRAVDSADAAEQLEKLLAEEHELSTRRRELHHEIDALRVQLGQEPGPKKRSSLLGG